MDKAVILAAGLGTRMRRLEKATQLSQEQATLAARGIKALIPVGRPFLDYVLSRLAEAGYRAVCLVIGPQHDEIRRYYNRLTTQRLRVEFAVQREPLGTANAVLAAAQFVAQDPFLVINSDNYYPVHALHALRHATGCATAGFDRRGLLQGSNISAERISQYAVLTSDGNGILESIVEKPDPSWMRNQPEPVLVSMNCWRFEFSILTACRSIDRSQRGEYEIPDAVLYSIRRLNQRYRVIPSQQPVLDLSGPEDIAAVKSYLTNEEVRL